MQFQFTQESLTSTKVDALIIPIMKDAKRHPGYFRELDDALKGELKQRLSDTDFKADVGKLLCFPTAGKISVKAVYVVGLGEEDKFNSFVPCRAYAAAARLAQADHAKTVGVLYLDNDKVDDFFKSSIEGVILGLYRFREYLSDKKKSENGITTFKIHYRDSSILAAMKRQLAAAQEVANATNLARDLVNRPPNDLYPETLAQVCRQIFKKKPFTLKVWGPAEIKKQKMFAFLSVAKGSPQEPRFIHIHYKPSGKAKKHVVLVGKGVTYDTGGLSLKPAKGMIDMKCDMAGAAAVIATIKAAAALQINVEIDGIIAATENIIGNDSTKPGDVISSASGKSIEVLNTDAEGRLTLADALNYACELPKVDVVIDLATLTGACVVALGDLISGGMTNDTKLLDQLIQAGDKVGERIWPLPLPDEYRDFLKADIADLKNIGPDGGGAGASVAGLFLQEFVTCKSWAHLDIAGPAFLNKDLGYCPRGGSGFGVRTLIQYLNTLG